jgi:predicted dithiol-disulfide oxidoreductase (DUF899 family)
MTHFTKHELAVPKIVDRATFHAELDALLVREKAHTREGDAIAAARRRLPMVVCWPEISRGDVLDFYAYSAKLLLFACSCASSDSASLPLR